MRYTSTPWLTSSWRRIGRLAPIVLAAAAAVACSGGVGGDAANSSGGSNTSTANQACGECGTAMLSLSSTGSSEFLSYIVTIDSLSLTAANGTVVQTVPLSTQVDLTQLANLSEIISANQVPAGRYVSASITIDYANATIVVNNGASGGVTIPASEIIDQSTGLALAAPNLTRMTLTLSLDSNGQLVVSPNAVANLALDFNLDASNTIAPSDTSPTSVTVNPVLTASLVPDVTKQFVVRGPLLSVNGSTDSYVVDVRPFQNLSNTVGQVTVDTSSTTAYTLNGTNYIGSAGFTALSALAPGTLIETYGSWDPSTQMFTAGQVLAGSSVAGETQSTIQGTVLAISGDTLTMAGGLVFQPGRAGMMFAPQWTATVGTGTTVAEQGQTGAFTSADISVGQQLQLSGTLSSSAGSSTLDATSGSALLLPTSLAGTLTAIGTNLLTVNLQSLANLPASNFTFTGTGTSHSADATATAYSIALPPSLPSSGLVVGSAVSARGFVAPFGSAPPDFNALTLSSYAQTAGVLSVRWVSPGVTTPFETLTSAQLLISQSTLQASAADTLRIGPVKLTPSTLSSGLQLLPNTMPAQFQAFAIVHESSRTISNYSSFNDLATALSTDLNGTTDALQLVASGPYDASTSELTTNQLVVILND